MGLPAITGGLGIGTKEIDFTTDIVITNSTRETGFTLAMVMMEGGCPLVIRAKPETVVIGVDPVTCSLDLNKAITCHYLDNATQPTLGGDYFDPISMHCDYVGQAVDADVV